MERRPLEITVISANDLKDVNLLSKMDVYAVVSIKGDPYYTTQKQRTRLDKDCGSNPKWDQTMKFTLDEESLQNNRLALKFDIMSERILGDREIGHVHVPIKELLDIYNNNNNNEGKSPRLGIGAGVLGGLLLGDMVSDVGEMASYDAGFDDGFGF